MPDTTTGSTGTLTARQAGALARGCHKKMVEARQRRSTRIRNGQPTSGQEVDFYAGVYFAHVSIVRLLTGRNVYKF